MPHISPQGLLDLLKRDFAQYAYKAADCFKWSPETFTISHRLDLQNANWLLLHELGHAELGHATHHTDIELIKQELSAWECAKNIADTYRIIIDQNFIEDCLDSYRIWLHNRSLCKKCGQTGLQTQKNSYSCLNCRSFWGVNEAKTCRLKRSDLSS